MSKAVGDHTRPEKHAQEWRLGILALVLVAVAIALTFWGSVRDPNAPRFLGTGDAWEYAGPSLFFMDHQLHDGELPLWNPLYFCGQPHAANPQSFLFYPPNLVRSLLTFAPTPARTHMGIVVMLFALLVFEGTTTYALARYHGLSFAASLVAAFGFVLSAPATDRAVGHWYFHNMLALLPLLILMLRKTLDAPSQRRKICYGIAAGLVYGVALLGGTPHYMILFAITIVCYVALYRLLRLRKDIGNRAITTAGQDGAVPKDKSIKHRVLQDALLLGVLFVIAALVATPLLLPAAQFSQYSSRVALKDAPVVVSDEDRPKWNVLQELAVYLGSKDFHRGRAAGAAVFLFALLSLGRIRQRDVALYVLLFLVLLDCSQWPPILIGWVVGWLAPYHMGDPARTMFVACLPLALLAGMGVDAALAPIKTVRNKTLRTCALLGLGAFVLYVVASVTLINPLIEISKWVIVLPALACLAAAVGGWLPAPRYWGMVIATLVVGETLAWHPHFLTQGIVPEPTYPYAMETLEQPKTFWDNNQRKAVEHPNANMYDLAPAINGYDPLHITGVFRRLCSPIYEGCYFPTEPAPGMPAAPRPTTQPDGGASQGHSYWVPRKVWSWEVSSLNQRGHLFLKRPFWLAHQYVDGPLPGKNALFPSATTVFLRDASELPIPQVSPEEIRGRGVSPKASPVSLLKQEDSPVKTTVDAKNRRQCLASFEPIRIPPRQSVLHLQAASNGSMNLAPEFTDLESGHTEPGFLLRLEPDGRFRHFEVALPDMTEFRLRLMAVYTGQPGTVSLREASILTDNLDENELIHVVSRSANVVEVDVVELPDYRVLTFLDAYFPGWGATVDGEAVPILRANDEFKAVVVPPGKHRVRFEFRSPLVYAGMAISLATALAACGVLIWAVRCKKPKNGLVTE